MEFFNPEAFCSLDFINDDVKTVKNLFGSKVHIN